MNGRDAETYTDESTSGRASGVEKFDQREPLPVPRAQVLVQGRHRRSRGLIGM
jgi:hypothetical protein